MKAFLRWLLDETTNPGVPAAGLRALFAKSDGIYMKDSAGVETKLGAGTGDVVGPAASDNDRVAVYDGTTGKLIKNSDIEAARVAAGPVGGVLNNEIVLFDGVGGRALKRATGSGYVKAAAGVYGVASAIPTADITADSGGTTPASDALSHTITQAITTTFNSTAIAGNFQDSAQTITVPAGRWNIGFRGSFRLSSNPGASNLGLFGELQLATNGNIVQGRVVAGAFFAGANQGASYPAAIEVKGVNLTASTTFKMRIVSNQNNDTNGGICIVDADGTAISGSVTTQSIFYATRVG